MTNVADVGHLQEQATKVNNIRPQILIFHGYFYKRTSNTVIEVWKNCVCDNCDASVRVESHFVRTMSLTDFDIQRHGLKPFEGSQPIRGVKVHSHAPMLCEPCKDRWLKGEALEKLQ
jgi:hypothetical protein